MLKLEPKNFYHMILKLNFQLQEFLANFTKKGTIHQITETFQQKGLISLLILNWLNQQIRLFLSQQNLGAICLLIKLSDLMRFVINLLMINLQSSKKLLKTYDQLLTQTLLKSNHFQPAPSNEFVNKTSRDTCVTKEDKSQQSNLFGRTISKMIKIEFHQNCKSKQPQQIKLKRKIMTSSEKQYLHKKHNYYSSVKQNYQLSNQHKANKEQQNSINLTVGSHAIQKIDYNTFLFTKDWKEKEESFSFKKRLKSKVSNLTDLNLIPKQSAAKVLILKKNERNRLQELLFHTTNTQRTPFSKNIEKTMDNQTITHTSRHPRNYSIQSFIPLRKNTAKKQPFIFGLGEKQLNPQKNRQKLVNYHDFLWKINYSNGLYVKPSEQGMTYRAYIGPGNNSNLLRSILKRRYWWNIVDRWEGCNFVWTQLKINSLFKQQKPSETKALKIYNKNTQIQNNFKTEPIACLQQGHERIFNKNDLLNWTRHMKKHRRSETTINDKTYKNRAQFLNGREIIRIQNSNRLNVHNHLEQNYYIGNKKSLFYHFKKYYELQQLNVFEALPLTFHIAKGLEDPQFQIFQQTYNQLELRKQKGQNIKNVWIMKPGQNSNRGNGITVCYSLDDIKLRLKAKQKNGDGSLRTFIIQKYMEKPLLYKGRKFDIRHYMLLTCFNGIIKAYWFPEGYIRTSSSPYSLKRGTNLLIHLTNDAVQKNAGDYGKFQKGNKISYQKFETYLNKNLSADKNNHFSTQILPEMKHLATQAVKSTYLSLDPNRKQYNFQLLGMDFMIDQNCKPWLIEINTNPCLQLSCPLLSRIIPCLIQQTFRICVDPMFPPPQQWSSSKKMHLSENMLEQNKFELIFDQSVNGEEVLQILGANLGLDSNMGKIEQDAQLFENDGVEEWEQKQV